MTRSSRLTRSEDIKHVREEGHSFAQRSLVIGCLPNQTSINRIAIIAGRSVGGAVQRNLAKRRMRSAFQSIQRELTEGFDLVLIARKPILTQDYSKLLDEMRALFEKADLMKESVN